VTARVFVSVLLIVVAPFGARLSAGAEGDAELRRLYESGQTYADFLAAATHRKDMWERNSAAAAVPADLLARARSVDGPMYLLAIAVDGCSDSANTIPYLSALTRQVEGLDLRIVRPEDALRYQMRHLTPDGRTATPTVLLLDADFNELGAWVERPRALQAWALSAPRDSTFMAQKFAWYDEDAGASTVEEVVALMESVSARAGDVLQLVTFAFLPGTSAEALALYRDEALPLYRQNTDMVSFRAFREVESPVPLDLLVVSRFRGMQGMDASNRALRELATLAGTSIGALYGAISDLSSGHTDEFVRIIPELRTGGALGSKRLTAFLRYQTTPGDQERFEALLREHVLPWETRTGVASETGRFMVSDGWHFLRMVSFNSLEEYDAWWHAMRRLDGFRDLEAVLAREQQIILGAVPDLSVR